MIVHATNRKSMRPSSAVSRDRARSLWVLAALASAAFVLQTAAASAVIVHIENGKALSFQPLRGAAPHSALKRFDAIFTNLDYNGGPVMPSNTNYMIYWAPAGSPAYPSEYQTGVNRYLEDLADDSGGHQNVDSVSTQYNDAAGQFANYESHFGGAHVDTDPYPANGCAKATICLTDAQLQTEIKKFIEAEGLPMGLTTEYFLLTPPKVESCFEPNGAECSAGSTKPVYCAYHGNIPVGETQIIYSNDPFVSAPAVKGCDDGNHPNGNASDGAIQGGLSHEHNESITDPEPNNAWTDFGGETGEIGDKCGGETGAPIGETVANVPYNQVIHGHFYWYQEEWSNQGASCLQRFAFSGEAAKASFTVTPAVGNQVHLDASASTAPGGVAHYNWQLNDSPGEEPSEPIETSTSTLSYSFGQGGPHTVALTVLSANGTSMGAARKFTMPFAEFSVLTAVPVAGQAVAFDASGSSAGTGLITGYAWDFGDGTKGSGVAPTHTYAATGEYEVFVSVTDSSGFTAGESQTLIVGPSSAQAGEGGGAGNIVPAKAVVLTPPSVLPPVVAAQTASATVVRTKSSGTGSADVFVRVSSAGLLGLTQTRPASTAKRRRAPSLLRSVSVHSFTAGVVKLHVQLTKAGARMLARKHRLKVTVTITFTTVTGLHAQSRQVTLTLTQSRRRH
ncbi:MAG TPA: PKD domain-containing protein [Solirubrobacteraceae bacterium]